MSLDPSPTEHTHYRDHGEPKLAGAAAPARKSLVARVAALLKRYKRVVQVVVLALIAYGVGKLFVTSWSQIQRSSLHVEWWLLVAGLALLVAQELSFAFIWRGILLRMGYRLDVLSSQRIYLGAEFVRYIPGNVWHVITRVLWAEQRGVPKSTGFASMVVELATKITSAALVFALSLFFWSDLTSLTVSIPREYFVLAGAVLVPLVLLGLHPRLLLGALNFALRKMGREPAAFNLRYRDILLITIYWGLSWILAGAGFYLVLRALLATGLPLSVLGLAIGIYALGWDAGFLAFITPSGLGFRELVIAYLVAAAVLGGPTPANFAVGLVVAFVVRMLSTGAEIISIAAAHAIPGGTPRPAIAADGSTGASVQTRDMKQVREARTGAS